MNTNMMELNLNELEMVNGGDTEKEAVIAGGSVSICAIYGGGAGFVAGGPVGAAIGAFAGAAVGGIVYGITTLLLDD